MRSRNRRTSPDARRVPPGHQPFAGARSRGEVYGIGGEDDATREDGAGHIGTKFTIENRVMLIKRPADIRPSEITPPELYARRREFLKTAAVLGAAALLPPVLGGNNARAADDDLKPTP